MKIKMYSSYRPNPRGLNFFWLDDLLNIYVFAAVSPVHKRHFLLKCKLLTKKC